MTTTRTSYNPVYWPGTYNKLILSDSGDLGTSTIIGPIKIDSYDFRVDGGSVSDWKGKIARGEQATSYLSGYRIQNRQPNDSAVIYLEKQSKSGFDDYGELVWWGFLSGSSGAVDGSSADGSKLTLAQSAAASRFVNQARSTQRALMGAVSAGEFAQTARMIKRPMQALRHEMDRYLGDVTKRAKGRSTRRQKLKAIADTWLEYNLGWRPLKMDIDGLRDTLGRTLTEDTRRSIYGSGTARGAQNFTDTWNIGTVTTFDRSWTIEDTRNVRYYGMMRVQGGNPGLKDLLGVSGQDVLPTIWELIPYSFVADYFVNIGKCIDAMAMRSADFLWAEHREKMSRTTYFYPLRVRGRDSGTWHVVSTVGSGGNAWTKVESVIRKVQGGWPIPDLRFQIPGLGKSSAWLNIAGLLISSRRGSFAIQG